MHRTTTTLLSVALVCAPALAFADDEFKPIELPKSPPQDELIEELDLAIDEAGADADAGLYVKRARQFAYAGAWKVAAADFRQAIERDPSKLNHWLNAGVALLLAGDRKGYETLTAECLQQQADNSGIYSQEKRAKLCTLPPKPIGKQADVERLAEESVGNSEHSHYGSYFTATQALVYFRYGKYDAAFGSISETDRRNALQPNISQDVYAINRLIESMCYAKKGIRDKALASFRKADKVLRTQLADDQLPLKSDHWHDWMIAKLLHDEASALLTAEKATPSDDSEK